MKYDIIPEYDELFKNDKLVFQKEPGILEITYALSFLGYLYTEKEVINRTFFEKSVGVKGININKAKEYLKDKTLITELGILCVWKLVFRELHVFNIYNYQLLGVSFNYLYRKIVSEQRSCINEYEAVSRKNSLMTFSVLNYLDNQSFEFIRTYFMFIKNKENFTDFYRNEGYGEVFNKFYEAYGLSIYDYLEGLYVIIMCKCEANFKGLKSTHNLSKFNFLISVNQITDCETRKKVEKVLEILSFDYEEASKWSHDTIEETCDFKLFKKKPLFKVDNDVYIPITRKFIQDQFFNSLIYKIRDVYEHGDNSFFILLGKLFESYVTFVFEQVCKNCKNEYSLIKEFEYGPRKLRKKSPDLMVTYNNDVYVFELKAARVLESIYEVANEDEIEKSIFKVIKKPIEQAINRINEIVNEEENINLTDSKNYYFIAVTLSNFPDHYSDFTMLSEQVKSSSVKIRGTFNFSIEEFEMLCDVLIQKSKPLNFFLEDYKENYPVHYSFKNYINQFRKGMKPRIFSDLEQEMQKFMDNINL